MIRPPRPWENIHKSLNRVVAILKQDNSKSKYSQSLNLVVHYENIAEGDGSVHALYCNGKIAKTLNGVYQELKPNYRLYFRWAGCLLEGKKKIYMVDQWDVLEPEQISDSDE